MWRVQAAQQCVAAPLSADEVKLVQLGLQEFRDSTFRWQHIACTYLPHRCVPPSPQPLSPRRLGAVAPGGLPSPSIAACNAVVLAYLWTCGLGC